MVHLPGPTLPLFEGLALCSLLTMRANPAIFLGLSSQSCTLVAPPKASFLQSKLRLCLYFNTFLELPPQRRDEGKGSEVGTKEKQIPYDKLLSYPLHKNIQLMASSWRLSWERQKKMAMYYNSYPGLSPEDGKAIYLYSFCLMLYLIGHNILQRS